MGDTFRARLIDELTEAGEPPMGDLVDASIARGRRLELRRRLQIGGTALAVAVLLGLTGAGFSLAGDRGHGAAPAASIVPQVSVQPSPLPADRRVEATPAGLLELLTRLLPPGTTGDYAGTVDDVSGVWTVQLSLDRGAGPAMIRLTVSPSGGFSTPGADAVEQAGSCSAADAPPCLQPGLRAGAPVTRADGVIYQVTTDAADCTRSVSVSVLRPSGVAVALDLATCRETGRGLVVVKPALTTAEAVAIGGDARWGLSLDPLLVKAGAVRFPRLSEKLGR